MVCTQAPSELDSDTAGRRDTTLIVQIGQAVRNVLDRRESKTTVCRNGLVKHARFTREISLLESRRGVAEHDDEPVCHRVVRLHHLLPAHAWSRVAHRQNHRTKADATTEERRRTGTFVALTLPLLTLPRVAAMRIVLLSPSCGGSNNRLRVLP